MYAVKRLEREIYFAHLHGRTGFDELLEMRRALAALATENDEKMVVIVWQMETFTNMELRFDLAGVRHYLENRQRDGDYAIHIGLKGFAKVAIDWFHRVFPKLLSTVYFAGDLATALSMAQQLRDSATMLDVKEA